MTASGETRANFRRQELGLGKSKALSHPSKIRKPGTSRVSNFAAEAIERLEKQRVSKAAIESIRELFWEFAMATPEVRPSNGE